jgi:hypothetical protein
LRTRPLTPNPRLARMGPPGSSGEGCFGVAISLVIPAKAGIHCISTSKSNWVPAFAGMTGRAAFGFTRSVLLTFPPVRRAEQRNAVWVNSPKGRGMDAEAFSDRTRMCCLKSHERNGVAQGTVQSTARNRACFFGNFLCAKDKSAGSRFARKPQRGKAQGCALPSYPPAGAGPGAGIN